MQRVNIEEYGVAAFRAAVATLAPDVPIELAVWCGSTTLAEALPLVLDRVVSMEVQCQDSRITFQDYPPNLVSFRILFLPRFEFYLAAAVVYNCPKLRTLQLTEMAEGGSNFFFDTLGESGVTNLSMWIAKEPNEGLIKYLKKDLLEELTLSTLRGVDPTPTLGALSSCTKLNSLQIHGCTLSPQAFATLPPSVTKVDLWFCFIKKGFNWSFLSQVTDFQLVGDGVVDREGLLSALTARLAGEPMKRLSVSVTFAQPGFPFDRVERLEIEPSNTHEVGAETVAAVAAAVILPGSSLRELSLRTNAAHIQTHLVPVLQNTNCRLTKLELFENEYGVADKFNRRVALLTLLQGQQIRRLRSPLHRLPMEMFRMVGAVLV